MTAKISSDRQRTNILKDAEYRLILYLCERMPPWVTPNRLTVIGLLGSIMVACGLCFAKSTRGFLWLSIVGLAVHWLGDSLDGRLAYYRNIPRKWYGFCLDVVVDWTSIFAIALGFYIYLPDYRFVPFGFVAAYGAAMIIALLRYKIADAYQIDSFRLGPTEMRILLAVVLLLEMFRADTLLQFGIVGASLLFVMDIVDLRKLLAAADVRDALEKAQKNPA